MTYEDLKEALKERMQYNEDSTRCENCMYSNLNQEGITDQLYCSLNRSVAIPVSNNGSCQHFIKVLPD